MKYAVVTGGTSGIGLGVATMLLHRGYEVFVTYAHTRPEGLPKGLVPVKCDQSDRAQTHALVNYVLGRCKTLDCLVCNAGMTVRKSLAETLDDDWDAMMEVAVNAHFIMVRDWMCLFPSDARIIFTGSQMGVSPHATVLGYGVTKAAVHALVKNLVKEFAGTGTTVNAVVPGFVDTPWQLGKPAEVRDNICRKTAAHRFATIAEVVKGFEFCLDNAFVNGCLLEINGGTISGDVRFVAALLVFLKSAHYYNLNFL